MRLFRKLSGVLILAVVTTLTLTLMLATASSALSGSSFNPARIIDDSIFFNRNTMNAGDIQNFLNAKVPNCRAGYTCLKDYTQSFNTVSADSFCNGIVGGNKSAAQIISEVSQACGVNPQVMLVLLQKEQSLVTDDWPVEAQYRSATGFGCPDTAACDSQYYGFFNQVYRAARQFKRYVAQPQNYNYAMGRTSFIAYQANNPGCGGSNVTIQTSATAALYNYTPYQPNQAALNNLYGTGDSCSAYGNRNFWRMFNEWFGPTLTDGYTVVVGPDNKQWLVFGSIKQHIPTAEVKRAWGFSDIVPSVDNAFLNVYATGPTLDRLYRINGSPVVYFVDGAKRYPISSTEMLVAWNLNNLPISSIPTSLANSHHEPAYLSYSVKKANDPSLYMVDGANGAGQTVLRKYLYPNTFTAWEGNNASITTVSDDYFNQISQAIGSPLTISKIAHAGNEYQVIAGQKMSQSVNVAPLYPGVAQSISAATFNRLTQTSNATHLVRAAEGAEVYLLDNGVRHHILSADVLAAWTAQGYGLNLVNAGFLELIPSGASLGSYAADVSGQLYIMDKHKTTVPGTLDAAYRNIGSVFTTTLTLANLFATSPQAATGFMKPTTAPQVYLIDNSGKKRHLESADKVTLWGGYQTGITILSDAIVNAMSSAASPSISVSDGTNDYVMEAGTKVMVDAIAKNDWGLHSPQIYSDGTLSRFSSGGSLANTLRDGNYFAYIRDSKAYVTVDQNIANTWAIDAATPRSSKLVASLLTQHMLTRFVQSNAPGDNRNFVVDGGNWYNTSSPYRSNLGQSNEPTMNLNPSYAPNTITNWASTVVKDASGKHYVIDGATKRSFANTIIQNHWTGNGSLVVPTVTNGFLNLLPNNGTIERAIKGSQPTVYSAENGTKRWILSSQTYHQSYAPFIQTSDALINALPSGSSIP